jgi:hypothetical protein
MTGSAAVVKVAAANVPRGLPIESDGAALDLNSDLGVYPTAVAGPSRQYAV